MDQKQDEANLSFKELTQLKKNNMVNKAQQQYEKNLESLVKCNFDNTNQCLTMSQILANFENYKKITGMGLVVQEEIIKEETIVSDNRILHVLTSHYNSVSNNQGDMFRFAVKTFDKNVYSGTQWDKFSGKLDNVSVNAVIKDSDGKIKKEFSGLTKYGIFEDETKIESRLIYPAGSYVLELDVTFNDQKFNKVLDFITYEKSVSPFNDPPISNAGEDQHVSNDNNPVTLDGTSSYDVDDTKLFYFWNQTSGLNVTLSDNNIVNPIFTMPDGVNTLIFDLVVDDGQKTSI